MKRLNYAIILFIIGLIFTGNVMAIDAFPTKIKIEGKGKTLMPDFNLNIQYYDGVPTDIALPYFRIKSLVDFGNYSCTSEVIPIPEKDVECVLTNFDKVGQEKGVGYIINLISNTNADEATKYWWSEFLIKSYLVKYCTDDDCTDDVVSKYEVDTESPAYQYITNASTTILNTGLTYKQIIANAKAEETKKYENVLLSVNDKTLTFEYDASKDIYISNEIVVTSNREYNVVLSNSKFEIENQGNNTYKFFIRGENINEGSVESLKVSFASKASPQIYYIAQNYDCGSNYQTATPLLTVKKTTAVTPPIDLSGSVKKEKGTIKILKVNEEGNVLSGAQIKIENSNKTYNNIITTTETATILNNLEYGEYIVTEIVSPDGYVLNKEPQKIILSESNINVEIKMTNKKTKVSIIKVSAEDNMSLVNAKLHIEDSEGNVIKEWITDENAYVVEGLVYGTYYVVEESAPKGYVLNKEKLKFEIDTNTDNLEISVKNNLTTIEISKISAVDNSELKGATLQIFDSEKKEMSCAIKGEETDQNIENCTWVSGDKPKTIIGLLPGKYYLKETIAPEGYVLNEEMVEFEINKDGTSKPVVMKNELEVEVPNTLSSRSALLIAISMFDIALGIGILTYVKKNKVEE